MRESSQAFILGLLMAIFLSAFVSLGPNFPSSEITSHMGFWPTLMAQLNLCEDILSLCSCPQALGMRTPAYEFWEDEIQPRTLGPRACVGRQHPWTITKDLDPR